jgi:putative glutathione S-transferase
MAGRLQDGIWTQKTLWETSSDGSFQRQQSALRERLGSAALPADAGRYHLYVSYACPWAHRTLIVRALRGLQHAVGVSVVDPFMGDDGWAFVADAAVGDQLYGARYLRELYQRTDARFTGRVTVPLLWDRVRDRAVNNESREIIVDLDTVLAPALGAEAGRAAASLYPEALRPAIDAAIDGFYPSVNNGVYRCGFAGTQAAYERAYGELFAALDGLEARLGERRFLCGDTLTLADVCLFTTLYRFDAVYYVHFKCSGRRIVDYPNLWGFVRDVYQTPGVAETCRLDHIKAHYYRSHPGINPSGIVPVGPLLDFDAPHGRGS